MRTGDKVQHLPTGEVWTVAYVDEEQGRLAWCGWPPGTVALNTCKLVEAIDDAGHWKLVREIAAPSMGNDARAVYCRRLLAEPFKSDEPTIDPIDALAIKIQAGENLVVRMGGLSSEDRATLTDAFCAGHEALVQLQGSRLAQTVLEQRRASALRRLQIAQRWSRRWKAAAKRRREVVDG